EVHVKAAPADEGRAVEVGDGKALDGGGEHEGVDADLLDGDRASAEGGGEEFDGLALEDGGQDEEAKEYQESHYAAGGDPLAAAAGFGPGVAAAGLDEGVDRLVLVGRRGHGGRRVEWRGARLRVWRARRAIERRGPSYRPWAQPQ